MASRLARLSRRRARGSVSAVIFGLVVVCSALALGEALVRAASVQIPGSVAGLVLLVVALRVGVVDRERLRPATDLLVRRMGLFFVPAGVIALTRHGRAILSSLATITIASVVSFAVVLVVVALVASRGGRA